MTQQRLTLPLSGLGDLASPCPSHLDVSETLAAEEPQAHEEPLALSCRDAPRKSAGQTLREQSFLVGPFFRQMPRSHDLPRPRLV